MRAPRRSTFTSVAVSSEHLLAPGAEVSSRSSVPPCAFYRRGFARDRRIGERFAQHVDRRRDLASLPLANDRSHQLPDVGRGRVMVAPIVTQMDQAHQAPVLQLAQAGADVRSRDQQRLA
jgi:hypothetical protein